MSEITTLVVDDEPLALDLVTDYVNQAPYLKLVGRCSNAKEAFDIISKGNIQLLFCDIQMPGMSGLTLMKTLQSAKTLPKVIFTTAFPEYALDGFKLDAVDYLLKPFDQDEFLKAAGKAKRLIELEENAITQKTNTKPREGIDFFFVKSEYKLVRIDKNKIVYIEGMKDYIKIYINGEPKPVLTLMSMKEMTQKLDENQFVRLHRSFIVNVSFVRGVGRSLVTMPDGTQIPIGDGYRAKFTEVISKRII